MARKKVKEFFERVEADPNLQAKLKKAATKQQEKAASKVVEIAKAAGFDITIDDLQKARSTELSPEELKAVAGGLLKKPTLTAKDCCYYSQGCMPHFVGS